MAAARCVDFELFHLCTGDVDEHLSVVSVVIALYIITVNNIHFLSDYLSQPFNGVRCPVGGFLPLVVGKMPPYKKFLF